MQCLIKSVIVLAVLYLGAPITAQADPLVLTITNPSQVVAPGGTLTFAGTVTNPNAQPVTITTVSVTAWPLDNPGIFVAVVSTALVPPGFVTNPVPGLTTGVGNIMSITFLANAPPGVYLGGINIRGRLPSGIEENSGYVGPITVTIAPVPEPTTLVLLVFGLAGVAVKLRKVSDSN